MGGTEGEEGEGEDGEEGEGEEGKGADGKKEEEEQREEGEAQKKGEVSRELRAFVTRRDGEPLLAGMVVPIQETAQGIQDMAEPRLEGMNLPIDEIAHL